MQGLIPFGHVGKDHPIFNDAKLIELHHYVELHVLDIVILNETWLKESIDDNEIFPESHPIDKDNPKKFRRNGGGVLIAISNSLAASFRIILLKCKAEMLAVEIVLENKTKIIISTCYRVGTLGLNNAEEILKGVGTLIRKKSVKKCILVERLQSPEYKLVEWHGRINN